MAKTQSLPLAISSRIKGTFPEVSAELADAIGQNSPSPEDMENQKQRAIYSDCLETSDGFTCHLPRGLNWEEKAWFVLCDARAITMGLRDYPPEELEIWLKHAKRAQKRGKGMVTMLHGLAAELLKMGFIKEGWWDKILEGIPKPDGQDDGQESEPC